ncbi:hypothetical protein J2X61_005171 [Bacillus sp. 3255]|nr:hypothetical protein [Bacillus sp. 3255]
MEVNVDVSQEEEEVQAELGRISSRRGGVGVIRRLPNEMKKMLLNFDVMDPS